MRAAAPLALLLAASAPCPPADGVLADPLPRVAAALHPGATLAVLAIGSAPPAQPATAKPAPGTGIPAQMAHALEAAVPRLHVALTVRAGPGLTATDLAGTIDAELPHTKPTLVLWLTGTVDAVREIPPGEFQQTLADAAARITAAGADLILVDPQYSRFLESNANIEPYLAAMRTVTTLPGVVLFHRYEIMRDWAGTGAIDLENTRREERPATAARLRQCLGRELAREILDATGIHAR